MANGEDVSGRLLSHARHAWDIVDVVTMQREQIGNLTRRHAELFSNPVLIKPMLSGDVVNTHVFADELRHVLVARHHYDGVSHFRHACSYSSNDIVCFVVIELAARHANGQCDLSTIFKLGFEIRRGLLPVCFVARKDTTPERSVSLEHSSHVFRFAFFDNAEQRP